MSKEGIFLNQIQILWDLLVFDITKHPYIFSQETNNIIIPPNINVYVLIPWTTTKIYIDFHFIQKGCANICTTKQNLEQNMQIYYINRIPKHVTIFFEKIKIITSLKIKFFINKKMIISRFHLMKGFILHQHCNIHMCQHNITSQCTPF